MTRNHRTALIAAAITFVLHVLGNPHYGFFRDELYFIACGRHPAFGYVDQPPLVPWLDALSQSFGPSLVALRALPAFCAGIAVYASCLLAFELGGSTFAAVLTALATALAPVLVAFGTLAGPDMVNYCTWPLAALFVLHALRGDSRSWLWAGLALGIASEAKYSVAFFGPALLLGIACTRQRREFATPWFWAGCGAAIAIALPSVIWQAAHGFPMIELLKNGQHGKNVVLSPPAFVVQEILITGIVFAPLWIAGFARLLLDAQTRWLGYALAFLFVGMIALHAKSYYPAPAFPILFAAGGAAAESATERLRFWRPVALVVALASVLLLPFTMPLLPEETVVAYARAMHYVPAKLENNAEPALPEVLADMHGWPELTAAVASVYDTLTPADRAKAGIYTGNYGEAAAIDFFGAAYGLPHAISGHNNYFLWGHGNYDGSVLIDVGATVDDDRGVCYDVRPGTTFANPWGMRYEDHLGIVVCRRLRAPLERMWARQRHYE